MSLCECHNAECRFAECHYADCHYAECHILNVVAPNNVVISVTHNLRYIMSNPVAFEVNLDQGSLTKGDGSVRLISLY